MLKFQTDFLDCPSSSGMRSSWKKIDPAHTAGRGHADPECVLCPVCDGDRNAAHANNLSQCLRCEHVFQSDLCVSTTYDSQYIHRYDQLPCEAMSALRWQFIQQALNLRPGSHILDVGYGNGAFLRHASRQEMTVFGLDVHGEDIGIPTVDYGTDRSFDLICFFDSLEHLPSFECLFGLRTGAVAVSMPNRPDFLLQTPQHWRHYKPGEHLHYFSYASLDALMRKWGLSRKVAAGFPEDALRGKLHIGGRLHHNIYTAIYVTG